MPKITVIVPVYNVEPYIHRCIDSILAQTYTDFELILVDDGSPDNCGAICDEYAEKDSRIHVIHQPNGGLSAARNAGLDVAIGDYICFVDSDDWIENSLLEKTVYYMELGYDVVAFEFILSYSDHEQIVGRHEKGEYRFLNEYDCAQFLSQTLVRYKIGWEACSRIYKRDIIEKYNLRFADNRKIFAEDLYFSLCYCSHIHTALSTDLILYHYTRRDDSIIGKQQYILNAGRMNELSKAVFKHFTDNNMDKAFLDVFPAMHYFILDNVISQHINIAKKSLPEMRTALLQDISDFDYFLEQMECVRGCKAIMRPMYPKVSDYYIAINIAQYYATGSIIALLKINLFEKWKAFKVKMWQLLHLLRLK